MNWKDVIGLILSIGGLCTVFYYGFCHYVLNKEHFEWEKQDETDKAVFYLFTSPIWLIVGIIGLFKWLFSTHNKKFHVHSKSTKEEIPSIKGNTFILVVDDLFQIPGRGPIVTGIVQQGIISTGDTVVLTYSEQKVKATCIGIEHNRQVVKRAHAGNNVGLLLSGIKFEDLHKGQIVTNNH